MTDVLQPRLLIVGAAPESLGAMLYDEATHAPWGFSRVATAGVTRQGRALSSVVEDYYLDVRDYSTISRTLDDCRPDVVVCTAGVNRPAGIADAVLSGHLETSFRVNVTGVMVLLQYFVRSPGSGNVPGKTFVAISSNSARLARRRSIAYCASKAALSMALRCAARELAGTDTRVWGYEPGLLAGTPMTQATEDHFGSGDPERTLHRMPGVAPGGLAPRAVARRILDDVSGEGLALNGVLVPLDAGEQ